MADVIDVVPSEVVPEANAEGKAFPATKQRKVGAKNTDDMAVRSAPKTEKAKAPIRKAKRNTAEEGAKQVALIDKLVEQGTSLKSAFEQIGMSKQTYYRWKRLAGSVAKSSSEPESKKMVNQASTGDELADLVELEAENDRLRKLLAKKLRAENADLRKRLGID